MLRRPFLHLLLVGAVLASPVFGQLGPPPTIHPPNFTMSLQAVLLNASGASMAVDRFGNVFIVDQANVTAGNGAITRVDASGAVTANWASGLGALSQLTYNPRDGYCWIASWSPLLPVVNSRLWRLDPTVGPQPAGSVPLIASGFTIDDGGRMYFGTQTAVPGAGLYRHDPNGPAGNLQFLGSGFAQNAILQSLPSGDVLIGGGAAVRRWTPMAIAPMPYYTHPSPLPNAANLVNSLARSPFNQLGEGGIIGLREFSTLCLCGQGLAYTADPVGQHAALFASESYSSPYLGLRCLASGLRQDLYWFTDQPGPGPLAGKILWRIQQVPAAGAQGSLLVTTTPGTVSFHVYGPVAGGDPFLLGAASALLPVDLSLFAPPFGILELSPFHPLFLPLLDGVGLFGVPNPLVRIPVGGHFQLSVTVPPQGIGLAFRLQAFTVSPGVAPNGLFFISNVPTLVLQ